MTATLPQVQAHHDASWGVVVVNWRAFEKNTLRGFFDVRLPYGMILHGLTFHEKNGSRWVGLPAKEYTKDGKKTFARIVEFTSRERADSFRDACLAALDESIARAGEGLGKKR